MVFSELWLALHSSLKPKLKECSFTHSGLLIIIETVCKVKQCMGYSVNYYYFLCDELCYSVIFIEQSTEK